MKVKNYDGEDVEVPEEPRRVHGCTMGRLGGCSAVEKPEGGYDWTIDPNCKYHAHAAAQPWNHTIPWNCEVYWDGCNHVGGPYFYDREPGETVDPFAWREDDDDDDDLD